MLFKNLRVCFLILLFKILFLLGCGVGSSPKIELNLSEWDETFQSAFYQCCDSSSSSAYIIKKIKEVNFSGRKKNNLRRLNEICAIHKGDSCIILENFDRLGGKYRSSIFFNGVQYKFHELGEVEEIKHTTEDYLHYIYHDPKENPIYSPCCRDSISFTSFQIETLVKFSKRTQLVIMDITLSNAIE